LRSSHKHFRRRVRFTLSPKEKRILLRRLQKAKALSKDAWLDRERPTATQFVQIEALQSIESMKAMIQ
jgi:hypothetical protein